MGDELIKKILSTPGITELNAMQQSMAQCSASRILLLAPTGSGKTIALAIPAIRSVQKDLHDAVQVLILAPSRELVQQIYSVVRPLALPTKTVAIYGGHPFADEVKSLTPAPGIVVATPGRLVDHLNRHTIDLRQVRTLVLDEYDKSLQLGFHDQMKRIVKAIPRIKTLILTSATVLNEKPDFLDIDGATVLDFTQCGEAEISPVPVHMVKSPEADKLNTLVALLRDLAPADSQPMPKTIVFVNHRESAERVYKYLLKQRVPAGLYHGGLDQREREIAIQLLNNGTTPVLVSTDLGSRGLDIDSVQNVIHYHIPSSVETFTHRNGRTGRQGAEGDVYVIVSPSETVPDFIQAGDTVDLADAQANAVRSFTASIYFPAGRKEKISARDILGFLSNNSEGILQPGQIGKITIADHYALAAVPRDTAQALVAVLDRKKIKNKSLRLSILW